jgi:hypothetical protein
MRRSRAGSPMGRMTSPRTRTGSQMAQMLPKRKKGPATSRMMPLKRRKGAPSVRMMLPKVKKRSPVGRMMPPKARPISRRGRMVSPGRRARTPITGAGMRRLVGMGLLATGAGVARWLSSRTARIARIRADLNRWTMVTIDCPPERLSSRADLPEPLARLGDAVDIKIARAPGDRGTELGARLREISTSGAGGIASRISGEDPRRTLRKALRHSKSLIETGEVMRPDWPPSTHPTPTGKLLELAGRRGGRL